MSDNDKIKFDDTLERPSFDPKDHGLDNSFRLTRFAAVGAAGCKLPQNTLSNALLASGLAKEREPETVVQDKMLPVASVVPRLGIGYDCSVIPLRTGVYWLVQATSLFYPIIDDPYVMGKIACAKVLNNLYAMGVSDCDNLTMMLGVSNRMTMQERDVVLPLILSGFRFRASDVGAPITGVQTIANPWCFLGGEASSVCQMDGFIEPGYAIDGDVLVLTKPLGTQLALNAYQHITGKGTRCKRMQLKLTDEEVQQTHRQAIKCMSRLNRVAAGLMFKHNAHGATHIGELGLLGHAQHLASLQRNAVSFSIYNLPLIKNVEKLARSIVDANNKLLQGRAPEHSGGLFICMPQEQATAFCKDLKRLDGHSAWIIGLVEKGNRTARLVQSPRAIPVKNE